SLRPPQHTARLSAVQRTVHSRRGALVAARSGEREPRNLGEADRTCRTYTYCLNRTLLTTKDRRFRNPRRNRPLSPYHFQALSPMRSQLARRLRKFVLSSSVTAQN